MVSSNTVLKLSFLGSLALVSGLSAVSKLNSTSLISDFHVSVLGKDCEKEIKAIILLNVTDNGGCSNFLPPLANPNNNSSNTNNNTTSQTISIINGTASNDNTTTNDENTSNITCNALTGVEATFGGRKCYPKTDRVSLINKLLDNQKKGLFLIKGTYLDDNCTKVYELRVYSGDGYCIPENIVEPTSLSAARRYSIASDGKSVKEYQYSDLMCKQEVTVQESITPKNKASSSNTNATNVIGICVKIGDNYYTKIEVLDMGKQNKGSAESGTTSMSSNLYFALINILVSTLFFLQINAF